ncbi:MAG TPA: hypothetical protein PLA83_03655 [Deltaproteobacteria bacterium]|jgi:hypothetical protein|nr:hypothetical protein [Deltaproteobacteria bacterium]HQI00237.1 hypothetical protein [Deltaproteobacteria bacterium]HQJ09260.1 hypothetical protein [Deltaproteobacteria bacterium]
MVRKIVTMLVIVSLFGFSTAYAHDSENDNDEAMGTVLIAGLAVVTAAILIASHDRHDEYRPSPRHSPERSYDSRTNDRYRHRDSRHDDSSRYNDRGPGRRAW